MALASVLDIRPIFRSGTVSPFFSACFLSTAPSPAMPKLAHILPSSCSALGRGSGVLGSFGVSVRLEPMPKKDLIRSVRLGSWGAAGASSGSRVLVGSSIHFIFTASFPSRVRVRSTLPSSRS